MTPYRTPGSSDEDVEILTINTFDWSKVDYSQPPGMTGHEDRQWRIDKRCAECGAPRCGCPEHAGAGPWTEPCRPGVYCANHHVMRCELVGPPRI